jgi:hypothetical protein
MVSSRKHRAVLSLVLLLAFGCQLLGSGFMETAERWLAYDVGKLVFKPQLGLSTRFTDNVFYGNDDVVTKLYLNQTSPYDLNIPGLGVVRFPGATNLQTSPGGVTLSTNLFFDAQNNLTNFNYTVRIPAHVETINGISVAIPQRDVISRVPGATTVGTNSIPLRPVESEIFLTASPGLRLQYGDTGRNTLTFEYGYDQISYVNNPELDTAQHRAQFGVNLTLGRFTISGSDSVQLLSSVLGGGNASGQDQVDRTVWTDNYRVTYDASAKTDLFVTLSHYLYDYEQGVGIYDGEEVRGSFGSSYIWTERLRTYVELGYGQAFVDPNLASQPAAPNSTVYGGFVGVRGDFSPRIQGNLKVGYETRSFAGTFAPGDEPASIASPAVTADISYAASVKTFLKLAYTRSTDISPQFAKQSFVFDRIQLTATQLIGTSGKWAAIANVGINRGDFSETPGFNFARTDRTLDAGIRLSYQPRRWLTAILAYEHEDYATEFADPAITKLVSLIDYQVNNLTLSINLGY